MSLNRFIFFGLVGTEARHEKAASKWEMRKQRELRSLAREKRREHGLMEAIVRLKELVLL